MGAFTEGIESATRVSKSRNPFDAVIARIDESVARRLSEQQKEREEIRTLRNLFGELSYKENLARETLKLKREEEESREIGIVDKFGNVVGKKKKSSVFQPTAFNLNSLIANAGGNAENVSIGGSSNTPPSYDPKTQKLQQNKKTGEYRVVPK